MSTISEDFGKFEGDVRFVFDQLTDRYKFNRPISINHSREFNVIYQNKTTQLFFIYDYGDMPDLLIGPSGEGSKISQDYCSIHYLILEICPEKKISDRLPTGHYDSGGARKIILKYRDILEHHMTGLLEGKFEIFETVKDKIKTGRLGREDA